MKHILVGYLASLYEYEDAGFSLFSEPIKEHINIYDLKNNIPENCYTYEDKPLYDISKILEPLSGKKLKITIEEIK